jgi:hypothetical protein
MFSSADELAEIRLTRLLERESRARQMVGFDTSHHLANRSVPMGIVQASAWAEDCMIVNELDEDEEEDEDDSGCQDFRTEIDGRQEVVEWMLTVRT